MRVTIALPSAKYMAGEERCGCKDGVIARSCKGRKIVDAILHMQNTWHRKSGLWGQSALIPCYSEPLNLCEKYVVVLTT